MNKNSNSKSDIEWLKNKFNNVMTHTLELDNLFNSEIKLKKELYKSHSEQIHQELNQSIESQI